MHLCNTDWSKPVLLTHKARIMAPSFGFRWQSPNSVNSHIRVMDFKRDMLSHVEKKRKAAVVISVVVTHHGLPSVASYSLFLTRSHCAHVRRHLHGYTVRLNQGKGVLKRTATSFLLPATDFQVISVKMIILTSPAVLYSLKHSSF